MSNDILVEKAKEAIDKVFGDTSCSKRVTLERMLELEHYVGDSVTALEDELGLDGVDGAGIDEELDDGFEEEDDLDEEEL